MDALVRKLTECPICMEKLANPKYLPCHHTFCCRCIETLCTDFNGRSCPLCRSTFDAPEDGRCTRLPTNVFAEQLVRVNRVVAETRVSLNELAHEKRRLQSQILELKRSLSSSETQREHAETRAESYQEAKTDAEASLTKEKQFSQNMREQMELVQRQSKEVKNEPKERHDVKGIMFSLQLTYTSGPVSTGMGDRVRVQFISVCDQPPRATQPSIPPGSVNEDRLRLGRQRQGWFIPLADERGVCR